MSSTTPSGDPGQTRSGYGYSPGPQPGNPFATLPVPGNGELVVYLAATILLAIITLASDKVDAPTFVTMFSVITFAYLISRGIAKASRVLEH